MVSTAGSGGAGQGQVTYVLFPLAEPRLLRLDLLGEPLPERLLLLLELGVLELARLLLTELARLHLRLPVVLVVQVLRRRDEVEHVRADKQRPQLPEVAVVLVLNCTVPVSLLYCART